MLDTNLISKNILNLRKQKGLKQQELAAKIHYSDKVISKWERGESLPDIIALSALADFFEITLEEITREIVAPKLEYRFDDKSANESGNVTADIINIKNIDNAITQHKKVNAVSKKPYRKKFFIFGTGIILILIILIPILVNAIKPKNYTFGDKIKTEYTFFQVNSIGYLQNMGGFTAESGMTYVVIEVEITNRGSFEIKGTDLRSVTIRKEDFQYSNSQLMSSTTTTFLNSSITKSMFFKTAEEFDEGLCLSPDSTRKGYLVFASYSGWLSNQKLTYTEYINETKTNEYKISLPNQS